MIERLMMVLRGGNGVPRAVTAAGWGLVSVASICIVALIGGL